MLNNKIWYFVPGKLALLPSEKIGSAVKTDQGALQDFKQIWISTDIFDKMTERDQAILILHEILVGFRLLRFDSSKNECLAFDGQWGGCLQYGERVRGKPSDLLDSDYADIRAAAAELTKDFEKLAEFNEWYDFLCRYGFSTMDRRFSCNDSTVKISPQELEELISGAKIIGYWPKYGFEIDKLIIDYPELLALSFQPEKPFTWFSNENCRFNIEIKENKVAFKLITPSKNVSHSFAFSPTALEKSSFANLEGRWISRVSLREKGFEKNKALLMKQFYDINLDFVGNQLRSVYVHEVKCLNKDCSSYSGTEDSLNYTCSSQKQMTFSKKLK